jgi:post-segregation antitoxin (ccd killing protein)
MKNDSPRQRASKKASIADERRLESALRADRESAWLQNNHEAIARYNRRIAEDGLLSDEAGLL